MKHTLALLLTAVLFLASAGCAEPAEAGPGRIPSVDPIEIDETMPSDLPAQTPDAPAEEPAAGEETAGEEPAAGAPSEEEDADVLVVAFDGREVRFRLNGSPAAESLLAQLPLETEVEDYSTNEKIFYPPQALDTADTPLAAGGAGTLAYYAPWGDVVFFYGEYGENPSLYELGQAVSGAEWISSMTGTVTIGRAEP